ncbi:MAG: choice-of-anchor J domain-containing protein [Muribaculaceae bacterium]|nr:choice-of-anchor J domain-containing protein [Muribaculaceae bacterium]
MKKSNSLLFAALLASVTVSSSTGAPLSRENAGIGKGSAYECALPEKAMVSNLPKMKTVSTTPVNGLRKVVSPAEIRRKAAMRSATSASRAIAQDVDLRGCVLYPNTLLGFHTLPKVDGGEFVPYGTTDLLAVINGGGYDDGEGQYHGVFYQASTSGIASVTIYHLDSESLDIIDSKSLTDGGGMIADDIAMDPVTGEVYGCYLTEYGRCWGKGDYAAGTRTAIRELGAHEYLAGVGCDASGQFYGVTVGGDFVKIDKLTGEYQTVSHPNIPYQYMSGGCVDTTHGKFLVSYSTDGDGSGIYEVDLATGEAARAVDFQKEVVAVGLYVAPDAVDEKSPAAPVLTVSAPEGTMTVSYSIALPSTLRDGTPLSGDVDYTLWANGELKARGSAAAGTTVSGEFAASKSGMTDFVAQVSNAAGNSPRSRQTIYVGKGLPSVPGNVTASWADGQMKITWNAVTESCDGGYLDPASVKYTISEGERTIAAGITSTEYLFDFPTPEVRTSYTFDVVADYDGKTSDAGVSNVVWVGAYDVPFETKFNTYTVLDDYGYTIVDANNDGKVWGMRGFALGVFLPFNSSMAADDWLITPPVTLEAGKVYPFSIVAHAESTYDEERMEVKAGRGATPEDMTLEVVAPTDVTALQSNPQTLTGFVVPDADGDYNIGVHGISDKYKYWLTVLSLSIGEGLDADAPAAVSELALVAEPTGLLTLSGSFRLPSQTILGEPVAGDVQAEVKCGDRLVATLSGAAGEVVTFDDTLPAKGDYTYTVTTAAGEVAGVAVSSTIFVGPYAAAAPESASVAEASEPGVVTVSWTPVTTDVNGNVIDAANVTYMVYSIDEEKNLNPVLDTNVSGESATFKALDDVAKQQFMQYAVKAFNRDAESESAATTDMVPVGNGYQLPVLYSGSAELTYQIMSTSAFGRGFWDIYSPDNLEDAPEPVASFDYFGCHGGSSESYGDLSTGKIDLVSATHPELSFYTYCLNDGDTNFVEACVIADGKTTLLGRALHSEMLPGRWTKVRYSLEAYAGKNIQVMLRAVTKTMAYTLVDEITVKETPDKDVAALSIAAPASVKAGEKFGVSVTVANYGYLTASDVKVNLYRDGDILASGAVASVEPDATAVVTFEDILSYFDEEPEALYSAELEFAGDKDSTNDATEEVTVIRNVSDLPAVTDLSGENTTAGNKLTWTPYEVGELQGTEITEDFEGATSWAHEFGDWTFLDVDQKPVSDFYPVTFPGIVSGVTKSSFFIFNREESMPGNTSLAGHSGEQYLVALYNANGESNDDWAISPRLSGDAQTISFYARSYSPSYPESIEILYTTEDSLDPEDYIEIDSDGEVPVTWTKYQYQLPAGTLHFAIRFVSTDTYMLMVDDVTFTPDPYLSVPTIVGYDIYRDGVKINDAPVVGGEYLDSEALDGQHTYHVVAKYAEGDSELSNPVILRQSGLDTVGAASLKVGVEGRDIVVSGAGQSQVTVVTVDGRVLRRTLGDLRLTVTPAIYLVTVGDSTFKLLVK